MACRHFLGDLCKGNNLYTVDLSPLYFRGALKPCFARCARRTAAAFGFPARTGLRISGLNAARPGGAPALFLETAAFFLYNRGGNFFSLPRAGEGE